MARLPDFLILGPPRSSTTRMFRILEHHPEVFVPRVKEPCYFAFAGYNEPFCGPGDDARVRSEAEYLALFEQAPDAKMAGEASPLYLWHPDAPARIRASVPNARLIAVLRNPADRAFSHYVHHKMAGRETEPTFEDALAKEAERKSARWSPFWYYKEVGFYGEQIERYLGLFPRQQLFCCLFEEFTEDPQSVLARLTGFLGFDEPIEDLQSAVGKNPSGQPRSKRLHEYLSKPSRLKETLKPLFPRPLRRLLVETVRQANLQRDSIQSGTRCRLLEEYASSIRRTGELLGLDVGRWLR